MSAVRALGFNPEAAATRGAPMMPAQNPYRPSEIENPPARPTRRRPESSRAAFWLPIIGCVVAGGALSAALFADGLRSPGDPTGEGIAFGLGGLTGLVVGILTWATARGLTAK